MSNDSVNSYATSGSGASGPVVQGIGMDPAVKGKPTPALRTIRVLRVGSEDKVVAEEPSTQASFRKQESRGGDEPPG